MCLCLSDTFSSNIQHQTPNFSYFTFTLSLNIFLSFLVFLTNSEPPPWAISHESHTCGQDMRWDGCHWATAIVQPVFYHGSLLHIKKHSWYNGVLDYKVVYLCLKPLYHAVKDIIIFMNDDTDPTALPFTVCTHTLKLLITQLHMHFWSRWFISHPHNKLFLTLSESAPVTCEDYEASISVFTVSPVSVHWCMRPWHSGLATSCTTMARLLPVTVCVSDQAMVLPWFCLPWSSHCGLQQPAVDQAPFTHTHEHTHPSPSE